LDDGGLNGYDCLPPVSVAKNVLTVGAADFITNGWASASDVTIRAGSAFGPADDGRVKPDLVTGGEKTSQSGAAAAGSLLLLREHYENVKGNQPLSSTLKGLVIHTADEAGSFDGPDYKFGWGLLNTKQAAEHISDSDSLHVLLEDTLANGDTAYYHVYVDNSLELKTTICWTDPAGVPVAFQNDPSVLDNDQTMLVNDLDIQVEQREKACVALPYVLDPQNPDSTAKKGDNTVDNVEMVEWDLPEKGWFTVRVTHKGSLSASQAYSLLITGGKPGLVYDGSSWSPYAPDSNTGSMDVLIMEGTSVTLPAGFKASDIMLEKNANLIIN
jgi:hypothetical protein